MKSIWEKLTNRKSVIKENDKHPVGLYMSSTGTFFAPEQLLSLNQYLTEIQINDNDEISNQLSGREMICGIIERLIQRLICGVATIDPRFSSKFLIKLHDETALKTQAEINRFEYLLRLDLLSCQNDHEDSPCQLSGFVSDTEDETIPQGFVKVQLSDDTKSKWKEFVTPSGFLRRDKIQERFVELLAISASGHSPHSPTDVEETLLCGSPGKVIDAEIANELLKVAPVNQLFFGAVGSESLRYPDPRDFRLAIVEEASGIRLRIGFLSPTLRRYTDIEVHIILAIGFEKFRLHSSDFPNRINLTHPELLMYFKAAQTGFYAVSVAPNPDLKSNHPLLLWRVSFPAVLNIIKHHHDVTSVPSKVCDVLYVILKQINRKDHLKTVNKNVLLTLLLFELEKYNSALPPVNLFLRWGPKNLSYHVLSILDNLLLSLQKCFQRSYFFQKRNILKTTRSVKDNDFCNDVTILEKYLEHLYEESKLIQKFYNTQVSHDKIQLFLMDKWSQIVDTNTDSAKDYFKSMITNKSEADPLNHLSKKHSSYIKALVHEFFRLNETHILANNDKIIFFINFVINQSLEQNELVNVKNLNKIIKQVQIAKFNLFHRIIREQLPVLDENSVIANIFKWIFIAIESEKKYLGKILTLYINRFLNYTHENSWYFDFWQRLHNRAEIESLSAFCHVINDSVNVDVAIMDFASHGWHWANCMLDTLQKCDLNLITFANGAKGEVVTCRHGVENAARTKYLTMGHSATMKYTLRRQQRTFYMATLPNKLKTILNRTEGNSDLKLKDTKNWSSSHTILRDCSSMTVILSMRRRHGLHRGLASILDIMVLINKTAVLQEISTLLPDDERLQMLETIKLISKSYRKLSTDHHLGANTLKINGKFNFSKVSNANTKHLDTHERCEGTYRGLDPRVKPSSTKIDMDMTPNYWRRESLSNLWDNSNEISTQVGNIQIEQNNNLFENIDNEIDDNNGVQSQTQVQDSICSKPCQSADAPDVVRDTEIQSDCAELPKVNSENISRPTEVELVENSDQKQIIEMCSNNFSKNSGNENDVDISRQSNTENVLIKLEVPNKDNSIPSISSATRKFGDSKRSIGRKKGSLSKKSSSNIYSSIDRGSWTGLLKSSKLFENALDYDKLCNLEKMNLNDDVKSGWQNLIKDMESDSTTNNLMENFEKIYSA